MPNILWFRGEERNKKGTMRALMRVRITGLVMRSMRKPTKREKLKERKHTIQKRRKVRMRLHQKEKRESKREI